MNNFTYTRVGNTPDAIKHQHATQNAQYVAGGTNLIDLLKYFLTSANALIDVNGIKENQNILENPEGGVKLGAAATNADTAYHPLIAEKYPLLSKAILAGASAQIRNMATNGGNMMQRTRCYYFYDANSPCNKRQPGSGCPAIEGLNRNMAILGTSEHCIAVFPSDMCVALAVLDAQINLSGPEGNRRIPFTEFHRLPGTTPQLDNNLLPGELITSIDLPAEGYQHHYAYLKLRDRSSYAFALVSVATGLILENGLIKKAAIALGGVAHKPWRVPRAEHFLEGKEPTRENFSLAADIILKNARTYRDNSFKPELAKRAIIRNGLTALQPEVQLPGAQPPSI